MVWNHGISQGIPSVHNKGQRMRKDVEHSEILEHVSACNKGMWEKARHDRNGDGDGWQGHTQNTVLTYVNIVSFERDVQFLAKWQSRCHSADQNFNAFLVFSIRTPTTVGILSVLHLSKACLVPYKDATLMLRIVHCLSCILLELRFGSWFKLCLQVRGYPGALFIIFRCCVLLGAREERVMATFWPYVLSSAKTVLLSTGMLHTRRSDTS